MRAACPKSRYKIIFKNEKEYTTCRQNYFPPNFSVA